MRSAWRKCRSCARVEIHHLSHVAAVKCFRCSGKTLAACRISGPGAGLTPGGLNSEPFPSRCCRGAACRAQRVYLAPTGNSRRGGRLKAGRLPFDPRAPALEHIRCNLWPPPRRRSSGRWDPGPHVPARSPVPVRAGEGSVPQWVLFQLKLDSERAVIVRTFPIDRVIRTDRVTISP